MSPRSNRVLSAIVFAALWTAGMLWRSASIDLQTVVVAVIAGVIAGLLMYWVFDKFSGRLRG
jgi:branched-subunit amino acid transport protein